MTTLLSLLFSISLVTNHVTPAGSQLHIRLTTTVGSYASAPGSPVSAVLIAPLILDGETILPAGSALSGKVKAVTRVGLGLRHETAGLDLEFNELTVPGGETLDISTRVIEVDNGRERVSRNGRIEGVRSTNSMCYRVSGYIRTALQWEIHAELAEWVIRSLIVQVPEPEIYYPAGVELTLALTQPLRSDSLPQAGLLQRPIDEDQREELERLVAELPYQTYAPTTGRSSDVTNVLFVGSRDRIIAAFDAAGWTQADPATLRGRITWIRAVAERRGDGAAPMSPLLLRGEEPDMSWQKGLNDVSKRHHIRMWKEPGTWRGQEIWIGAATRDVDFAFWRPGGKLTHKIEEDVDQERDKVAYDLAFTTCGNILNWTPRAAFPRSTQNATGDPIVTNGSMVVIRLNACAAPRSSTESSGSAALPEHGTKLQRFARREILSARNELIRTNPYWRSYEGSRWIYESIRRRMRPLPAPDWSSVSDPPSFAQSARLFVARLH
jgi:hypothetical protein